jgi:hypothetical protein
LSWPGIAVEDGRERRFAQPSTSMLKDVDARHKAAHDD